MAAGFRPSARCVFLLLKMAKCFILRECDKVTMVQLSNYYFSLPLQVYYYIYRCRCLSSPHYPTPRGALFEAPGED